MQLFIRILLRLVMTVPVFIFFGLGGVLKLWRYGGGLSVNHNMELNTTQAVGILEDKIAELKAIEAQNNNLK